MNGIIESAIFVGGSAAIACGIIAVRNMVQAYRAYRDSRIKWFNKD